MCEADPTKDDRWSVDFMRPHGMREVAGRIVSLHRRDTTS